MKKCKENGLCCYYKGNLIYTCILGKGLELYLGIIMPCFYTASFCRTGKRISICYGTTGEGILESIRRKQAFMISKTSFIKCLENYLKHCTEIPLPEEINRFKDIVMKA